MKVLFHAPLSPNTDVPSLAAFFGVSEELLQEEGERTLYSLEVEGQDTFVLLDRPTNSKSWWAYIISPYALKYTLCDVHGGWTHMALDSQTLVSYLIDKGMAGASVVKGEWVGFDAAHSGDKTYHSGLPNSGDTYRTKDYMLSEIRNVLNPQTVASFSDIRSLCNGSKIEKGYALLAKLLHRHESSDLCRDYLASWYTHLHRDAVREYVGEVLSLDRFWDTDDTRLAFAQALNLPRFKHGLIQRSEQVDFVTSALEGRV